MLCILIFEKKKKKTKNQKNVKKNDLRYAEFVAILHQFLRQLRKHEYSLNRSQRKPAQSKSKRSINNRLFTLETLYSVNKTQLYYIRLIKRSLIDQRLFMVKYSKRLKHLSFKTALHVSQIGSKGTCIKIAITILMMPIV